MRKLKGYRTFLVMGISAVPPILDTALPLLLLPEWKGVVPVEWWPVYVLAVQIAAMYMRSVTTTPLGRSE